MKTIIPINDVSYDYMGVLNSFISILKEKQAQNIKCIYLSGSYARGEATNASDLDVFCIFNIFDSKVLTDVGYAARNTPISYETLEINTQCMFMNEFLDDSFKGWVEKSARVLDSVLLFGDDIFGNDISKTELQEIYKKYFADILISIRHYICVDEPKDKLTYKKIKKYILKPLMFPLRMERYCANGFFPLTIRELEESLDHDDKRIVLLFISESAFNDAIYRDHKEVLIYLHNVVLKKLFRTV